MKTKDTAASWLLAACEEFVRKVECGEARSTRSYAQMKAAIAKAKEEERGSVRAGTANQVLIYLASPYTHESPFVMLERFDTICCVAAKLMSDGVHLFCPIAHTHPIAVKGNLPRDFVFWEEYDRKMLAACHELWVCTIDGWKESRGVAAEVRIAVELGLPVKYIEPKW